MARDHLFHAPRAGARARTDDGTSTWTAARAGAVRTNVDWAGLRQRMRGTLLRPGDPGFEDARKLFNPLNDDHVPAAVAQCESVSDVREAVLAAANRVPWPPAAAGTPMSATPRRTAASPSTCGACRPCTSSRTAP